MSFLDRHRGRRGTPDTSDAPEDASPGWDAITAALDAVHPGQPTPLHSAPPLPWSLGGEHPLDGVSVYRAAEPTPHWHFVGYGMSDLYSTETAEPGAESGWGVEFTMRLADPAAAEDASTPPSWPISLMQNIARYVVTSGNEIRPGHHFDANGPIQAGSDTALTALLFTRDPQLGRISTPAGEVEFVQIVGATAEDLADATAWSGDGLLSLFAETNPLLVTDLARGSIRELPGMAERIAKGTQQEGSSTHASMVQRLAVSPPPRAPPCSRSGRRRSPRSARRSRTGSPTDVRRS